MDQDTRPPKTCMDLATNMTRFCGPAGPSIVTHTHGLASLRWPWRASSLAAVWKLSIILTHESHSHTGLVCLTL